MADITEEEELPAYPPWNFSWIVKGELAAMAWPQTVENVRYIVKQGINHLITLSPEKKPPRVGKFPGLKWTVIPIEEFEAPSITQIKSFIEICQRASIKHEVLGIHCRMGRGRTGVMAACYLVNFYDQSPERAIINIRLQRPGSVETYEQERAVIAYHDVLRGTYKIDTNITTDDENNATNKCTEMYLHQNK